MYHFIGLITLVGSYGSLYIVSIFGTPSHLQTLAAVPTVYIYIIIIIIIIYKYIYIYTIQTAVFVILGVGLLIFFFGWVCMVSMG